MTTDQEILTALAELRESDSTDYHCPDWCERTDHHADVLNEDNPPYHYGPDFGAFRVQTRGDGPFIVECELPGTFDGRPGRLKGAQTLCRWHGTPARSPSGWLGRHDPPDDARGSSVHPRPVRDDG